MVRRVVWFDHILLITCDGKRSICTKSENSFSASDICICKKRYGFVKIYPISHSSMFQYFLFLTKTRDSILGYINIFKQFFHPFTIIVIHLFSVTQKLLIGSRVFQYLNRYYLIVHIHTYLQNEKIYTKPELKKCQLCHIRYFIHLALANFLYIKKRNNFLSETFVLYLRNFHNYGQLLNNF